MRRRAENLNTLSLCCYEIYWTIKPNPVLLIRDTLKAKDPRLASPRLHAPAISYAHVLVYGYVDPNKAWLQLMYRGFESLHMLERVMTVHSRELLVPALGNAFCYRLSVPDRCRFAPAECEHLESMRSP
jgi:hypothetical protein